MEPEKHNNNSDTSTAESDQKPTEETSVTTATVSGGGAVGRSYDCAFCKRGFTNAQALGGHMNIHRKDKAKAKSKQKNQVDVDPLIHSFKSNENCNNLSYFPTSNRCDPVLGGYVNYQVYFPASNRGIQTGNYQYENYFPVCRDDYLKENHMDENLSLRIGLCAPPVEDEGEVDLELRLGRYR